VKSDHRGVLRLRKGAYSFSDEETLLGSLVRLMEGLTVHMLGLAFFQFYPAFVLLGLVWVLTLEIP
jgi:hypothetical protein